MLQNKCLKLREYLLYLLVFTLPWQTRWMWHLGEIGQDQGYWEYGTFSLYAFDIVLLILVICIVVLGLTKDKFKIIKPEWNLWIPLLSLLVIGFFSLYWGSNKEIALYAFAKLLEGVALCYLVYKINLSLVRLGIVFVITALIQSFLAIYQFLAQTVFASKYLGMASHFPSDLGTFVVETTTGRFLRAYGSLPHPNILATFLITGLITATILYYLSKRKSSRYLLLTTLIIIQVGLFFTFSRLAWIFLVLLLIFLVIIGLFKKRVKLSLKPLMKCFVLLLITYLVFTFIYPDLVLTRFQSQARLEQISLSERGSQINESTQLIKGYWLEGVGIGNYTHALSKEIKSGLDSWSYQPVHNIYLLIFSELGIFGLVIWLLILFQVLKRSAVNLRVSFQDNLNRLWLWGYSLVIITFFIAGCFDHFFWTLHPGIMIFWLIYGLWLKSVKTS